MYTFSPEEIPVVLPFTMTPPANNSEVKNKMNMNTGNRNMIFLIALKVSDVIVNIR
jgi:hypothetical protein